MERVLSYPSIPFKRGKYPASHTLNFPYLNPNCSQVVLKFHSSCSKKNVTRKYLDTIRGHLIGMQDLVELD
jgi:hypothetical protein